MGERRKYRYCVVPTCYNTSTSTPDKIFISVPSEPKKRELWLRVVGKDPKKYSNNSTLSCCEDHFDLPNDIKNWTYYTVMGGRLIKKKGIVPHLKIPPIKSTLQNSESNIKIPIPPIQEDNKKLNVKESEMESNTNWIVITNVNLNNLNCLSQNKEEELEFNTVFISEEMLFGGVEESTKTDESEHNLEYLLNLKGEIEESQLNVNFIKQEDVSSPKIEDITIEESLNFDVIKREDLNLKNEDIRREGSMHNIDFINGELSVSPQERNFRAKAKNKYLSEDENILTDLNPNSATTSQAAVIPTKVPVYKIVKNKDFLNEESSLKRTIQVLPNSFAEILDKNSRMHLKDKRSRYF